MTRLLCQLCQDAEKMNVSRRLRLKGVDKSILKNKKKGLRRRSLLFFLLCRCSDNDPTVFRVHTSTQICSTRPCHY